ISDISPDHIHAGQRWFKVADQDAEYSSILTGGSTKAQVLGHVVSRRRSRRCVSSSLRGPGASSMTRPHNYSKYLSREESRIGGQDDEASRPAPSDVTVIDPVRPDRCSTGPHRYRRR